MISVKNQIQTQMVYKSWNQLRKQIKWEVHYWVWWNIHQRVWSQFSSLQ